MSFHIPINLSALIPFNPKLLHAIFLLCSSSIFIDKAVELAYDCLKQFNQVPHADKSKYARHRASAVARPIHQYVHNASPILWQFYIIAFNIEMIGWLID